MTATRRWATIAVVAAVTTAAVYLLAVWTTAGQQLENAALRGADESYNHGEMITADDALAEITIYSLAAGSCTASAVWRSA